MKRLLRGRATFILTLAVVFVVAIALIAGCSITNWTWVQGQVMAGEVTAQTFSTQDRYSMLVLYLRDGNYYLQAIRGTRDFEVVGDKLYMDGDVIVNDAALVGWGLYPEQDIEVSMEWDEESQEFVEVPVTLEELDLVDFTADDLPRSAHFARLDAIYPETVLKAEVSRYYNDQWFSSIRCLVSLWAMQAYQAGDIVVGDYVWVYYTNDPRPGHEHEEIPIVIDKVIYDG